MYFLLPFSFCGCVTGYGWLMAAEERFWSKVDKDQIGTGCWVWKAFKDRHGYGKFWDGTRLPSGNPRKVLAHRFAYELLVGPIPDGLQIDHLCRNRSCVNPAHMEPVTSGENVRRGNSPRLSGERMRAKAHCPQGHKYTQENTYVWRGVRHCRECRRIRAREQRRKNRASSR